MKTGLKVKRYIEKGSETVVIKENIVFSFSDIPTKYIPLSEKLRLENKLLLSNFNDNKWIVLDEFENSYPLFFTFELNPTLNSVLKCYVIFKLSIQSTSSNNTYRAQNAVKKFLLDSNFLNKNHLITYIDSIKNWNKTQKQHLYYVKEFLKFYSFPQSSMYLDKLDKIIIPLSNSRQLTTYKSILLFDSIISDFISNASFEKKKVYYPILLWWQLTKIIPIRPIEFAILKHDCLSKDMEGNYYIKIDRRKNKNGQVKYKTINIVSKFKIQKDLYTFIEEYICYSQSISTGKYIFSQTSRIDTANYPNKIKRKSKIDLRGTVSLHDLLGDFYKNIIRDTYGYIIVNKVYSLDNKNSSELQEKEIEKICLGDTRHIAICNMMLQGFNPLTIAQLSGHYTLSEQSSYAHHLETFISSYTYVLAKHIRNKININSSHLNNLSTVNSSQKVITKALLGEDFYTLLKVPGGRCMSKNFPFECNTPHIYCEHFIPDETLSIDMIAEQEKALAIELKSKIDLITSLSTDLIGFESLSENNNMLQNDLKTASNSINTLIYNKATLEAYKYQILEVPTDEY